ncbi:hypothetical protein SPBR_05368 [Sporothrix brasiliensis 5110]|uniref:CST complex subunit Ten1 n=1 Tax=Sporothrix brasiliensis 5110 TaxID=1398154 RepID=A0A0C2F9Y2_9PEZI|nr:uncharacterized protein SPBR_05368 [Sporothrix brasiliensis 5110]KIH87913.1 hypothetical protein SPBR_05368 [Sporothrix brasiliensis 5110]
MPSTSASEICFLSSLPAKITGQKVRFLGCVTDYDPITGVLTLQHPYQPPTPSTGSGTHVPAHAVRARVNVDLVLKGLTAEQTTVGAWVNVMGYVTGHTAPTTTASDRGRGPACVDVQALILWSTGPLDVQAYERQLDAMLTMRTGTVAGTGT